MVQYKRVLYEYKDEHGKIQNIFLLDTILNISEVGKMSSNLVEKILSIAVETNSYRDAAAQIMETINLSISHEAVRNVVIKEGYKLLFKEREDKLKEICTQFSSVVLSYGFSLNEVIRELKDIETSKKQ